MCDSPRKSRKKAIEPPLTLKSREVLLSKGRHELYYTWLSNQSHRLTQVHEAQCIPTVSTDHCDLVQSTIVTLQEVRRSGDQECPEPRQLAVLSTTPSFPWPLIVPEGFGPR